MCDWEPAEVMQCKVIVARKRHVCTECGTSIKTGEKYLNVSWLNSAGTPNSQNELDRVAKLYKQELV